MALHFQSLYNALSHDLWAHLTAHLDRHHWEKHGAVKETDMDELFKIIIEAFDETEPDIQYMCMVALRCTLIRPYPHDDENNPYACESVYDLAVRNVQHVLADHRKRLIRSLHAAHHSALVIQQQWKKCTTKSEYHMCRARLDRELDELVTLMHF